MPRVSVDRPKVGFFFWPFDPDLVTEMGRTAERYGYDLVGVADTPGNAMDPWVSSVLLAQSAPTRRLALCVTNLTSRHPSVTAAAAASLVRIAGDRIVLGIGAGHSGTRNLGIGSSTAVEMEEGIRYISRLLRGEPASLHGGDARLPWVRQPADVFLAASHPRSLRAAGAAADGAFVNFGLGPENVAASRAHVRAGAEAEGRTDGGPEIWQVAALDCSEDGDSSRQAVGAMLAFLAGYVIGERRLGERGVPEELQEPLLELRRRYSTRPGAADADLVRELGLFDYLSRRLSVCGTPQECREQLDAAVAGGATHLMFTVSLAADPVRTVALFGEQVLSARRGVART